MLTRIALCAGVAIASLAAAPVRAESVPSPEQMYKMLLEQQRQIKDLEKRAIKAEQELEQTKAALRTHRGAVSKAGEEAAAAKKDAQAARAAAIAAEKKMATKEDLDRTKTELGTQPTQSVVRIPTDQRGGWFAFGEFLYLQAAHDLNGYAVSVSPAVGLTPGASVIPTSSNIDTVKSEFGAGFRAGFGYQFPGTGWDVAARVAYLRNSSESSVSSNSNNFVFASQTDPSLGNINVASASSKYRLDYFVLDLEAGQKLEVGRDLMLRLSGGIRYASMRHRWLTQYIGGDLSGAVPSVVDDESKMWGVGPRIAASFKHQLPAGLYLSGDFGASLLIGGFKTTQSENLFVGAAGVPVVANISRPNRAAMIPAVESRLVLGWATQVGNSIWISAEAGYEFQGWFGGVRRIMFVDDINDSKNTVEKDNLILHGPIARLKIRF